MRRLCLALALFFGVFSAGAAQTGPVISLGTGAVEVNGYSRGPPALGFGFGGEFRFVSWGAVGAKVVASSNFSTIQAVDLDLIARAYPVTIKGKTLFLQLEGGRAFGWESIPTDKHDSDEMVSDWAVGLAGGWRQFPDSGGVFVEPFVRIGYPYLVAVGIGVGYAFSAAKKKAAAAEPAADADEPKTFAELRKKPAQEVEQS